MHVNIFYDEEDADIIELPDFLMDELEELEECFLKWMFDKDNNHQYWVIENNKKKYCAYDTEAFVEWVNEKYLKNRKDSAKIIQKQAKIINKKNSYICF